jgi:hypothetical protein
MIKKNKQGTDMKIIKVISNDKLIIQFQDEHKFEKEVFWQNYKRGTVKNPYDKIILNRGYIGVGKYKSRDENNKITEQYNAWSNILLRCYSDKHRYLFESYPECEISEEWCNFQTLAEWYDENKYPVEGRLHVDKDVLVKGNKIYSPDTCLLLPQRINMIFMEKPKTRDKDLPNTIYRCSKGFQASYNGKSLGVFETVDGAITAHDNMMRIHIKEVAEEYKVYYQARFIMLC